MECAITYTKSRNCGGVTLVEMMIGMAIASTLLLGLASLTIYTARSFGAVANYVDLDRYSRNTLDLMVREIRRADSVVVYSTNQLIVTNIASGTVLSYTYDPVGKTLTRTNGASSQQLLTGCDAFSFAYFMDTTISNTFEIPQQGPITCAWSSFAGVARVRSSISWIRKACNRPRS